MRRRVVVTGIGILSPLGNTVKDFFDAALRGVCRIGTVRKFDVRSFAVQIGGEIQLGDEQVGIHRFRLQEMPRPAVWAVLAARQAVADADLDLSREDPYEMNVVLGVATPGLQVLQDEAMTIREKGPAAASPLMAILANPAAAALQISQDLGLQGEVTNITASCSSSSSALGYALRLIQHGEAECVLAGGVDEGVVPIYLASFGNADALSRRNADPLHASRPFDRQRDGYVLSDAACLLVLEEYERAQRRGAAVYCELRGFGATHDAVSPRRVGRSEEAGARAVERALQSAGRGADEVDYYCAHGTSSKWTDVRETRMVKRVFRERARGLAISSIKSMMGHPLGAAGAVQAATAALSIRHQAVPPTINLVDPDPECDLDYVPQQARQQRIRNAVVYSLGQGGSNTALVLAAC